VTFSTPTPGFVNYEFSASVQPSLGESRRLDLAMIDPAERERFHHTDTAAALENLPQNPFHGNSVKIGLLDFQSGR
jgi:hypothetical protein